MRPSKSPLRRFLQQLRIAFKGFIFPRVKNIDPALDDWENPRQAMNLGRNIIIFGFGGFLLWAFFAPLEEGVVASGSVAVESKRKTVSHLTGGVVASIRVKENQGVKAGDILVTFEDVQAKAALDTILQQYVAAAVRLARLKAEQSQGSSIQYPEEIRTYFAEPWGKELVSAQEHLFKTRKLALDNEQAIYGQNLAALDKQLQGTRQQLTARTQQSGFLQQEIDGMRGLVAEGYASRNQLLAQERTQAELSSVTSELQASIAKNASQAAEIRLRQLQLRQDFLRDVEAQLVEAQRDQSALSERLKAVRDEYARTVVRAPADGQVVSLQTQTIGGIVGPGGRILEIVPQGDALLLDVQVQPGMVNRIHPGQATDIRINAFSDRPQLVVEGRVSSVSSDRHTDPLTGLPYFLARVEVTPEGLKELGSHHLHPGMPVDVIIKAGERTFAAYLMKPLTLRMFSALREP
ncbi:HlyD family type I secretion periplasmic adaptor subunit [Quatrionicoccus australiensis]|uniref:HlyD family type I secretion periplasmic adaptor subunit n=1 Tax=Quatrionicoccus australiensis TaxID=138118 RepID=UPI001CF97A9A|nr:HlyD family type I secretion periplasmic adaptor subunit [Quatrionicoccus australiensis]MCB4360927.1 HlyD family type I secretion periplasmic adaptor subunit [Quatrionicoccus australiensis]